MLTVYPDYYPAFRCIAGACRHSCCIGWEIDIDEESLARYQAMPGPLGERLRGHISADDPPHFVLGEGERCPFLNQDNLCDLILAGDEELLCQICDDHPRFRNFLPGYTEIGLGLCCEGAAQLILSQTEPGQLLAGYSFELYPLTKTKSTHRVKVTFSAVPHVWSQEDTGYLCISGGEGITEPVRSACRWENGRLIAEITLDVANGYELCFSAEHPDGSQEQQILEDLRIQKLAQECSIPIKINPGSFSGKDGTITLTDFSVNFNIPSIYEEHPTTYPNVTHCEYRLYRRPQDDSKYELIRADMMDYLSPSTVIGYHHQICADPVRFQNVDLINCNHLRLTFYVKLSSGVEQEIPITILVPDGKGGVTA